MNIVTAWYQLRAAAHNLSLILRKLLGTGQPRGFSAAWQTVWTSRALLQTLTKALWKLRPARIVVHSHIQTFHA